MTIEDLVARVPGFVNELSMALEQGAGLAEIEPRVAKFVNRISSLIRKSSTGCAPLGTTTTGAWL